MPVLAVSLPPGGMSGNHPVEVSPRRITFAPPGDGSANDPQGQRRTAAARRGRRTAGLGSESHDGPFGRIKRIIPNGPGVARLPGSAPGNAQRVGPAGPMAGPRPAILVVPLQVASYLPAVTG